MEYSQKSKFYIAPSSERHCIIRTSDGVQTEHRGADAPSVEAVLLFFKQRKLKALQERNRSPLDRRERMARDFFNRFGKRGVPSGSSNSSIASADVHWWERGGTSRT